MGPAHSEEDEAEGFILILVKKKNKFFFRLFWFFRYDSVAARATPK